MTEHMARRNGQALPVDGAARSDGARTGLVPSSGTPSGPDADTRVAVRVRELLGRGDADQARLLFARLVDAHQRRALALAYHYLRDRTEAEEAVQDAFVKVYRHMSRFDEAWPFGVWFTRILINGCLDRQKAHMRRGRRLITAPLTTAADVVSRGRRRPGGDPEAALLGREQWAQLTRAVRCLGDRQRLVFLLCHYSGWTPREVGAMLGLSESTVRVHLFRAVQRLRSLLGAEESPS